MSTLADLERRVRALEDIQAISQLKHRYFRLLDHQSWAELRECFTEDVETHYENGHYRFVGIDDVMRFLSESLEGLHARGHWAVHLGHHPEIELLGNSDARGRWTVHTPILDVGSGHAGRQECFYEDEYRRVDGVWRIRRIGFVTYSNGMWTAPELAMRLGSEVDSRALNAAVRATEAPASS